MKFVKKKLKEEVPQFIFVINTFDIYSIIDILKYSEGF